MNVYTLKGINGDPIHEKLNEIIKYTNTKFKETCEKYNITYIDTKKIKEDYNIYPTQEEYEKIGSSIIEIINTNLLNK